MSRGSLFALLDLDLRTGIVRLHDESRLYLGRAIASEEAEKLHLRLVESWDELPGLPDVYAWRSIAYHMVQAGRKDDLRRLLLDFNYLQGKLSATDPNALIADYDYVVSEQEMKLIQSTLRLSAHVLARDSRELAGQLIGRLVGHETIKALLEQAAAAKAWPWFRPLAPSLTEPGGLMICSL